MRFHLGIASTAKNLFTSSAKEKAVNGGNPKPVDSGFGSRSPSFGNKEEAFLDSRAWLDSDCEDDFYSVSGDFTPSQGSTPDHQFGVPAAPRPCKVHFADTLPTRKSEPSPTGRKTKLADLLQGSNQQNGTTGVYCVETSDATPNTDSKHRKEKRRTKHCCFPRFLQCLGLNGRRKQKLSPKR